MPCKSGARSRRLSCDCGRAVFVDPLTGEPHPSGLCYPCIQKKETKENGR